MSDPQTLSALNKKEISILIQDQTLNEKTAELENLPEDVKLYYFNLDINDRDMGATPVSSLWSIWNNTIICTEWRQLENALSITTNSKKVFYIYDIDWHRANLTYEEQCEILDKCDKIYCRSETHQELIKSRYGFSPEVIESFDFNKFRNIE